MEDTDPQLTLFSHLPSCLLFVTFLTKLEVQREFVLFVETLGRRLSRYILARFKPRPSSITMTFNIVSPFRALLPPQEPTPRVRSCSLYNPWPLLGWPSYPSFLGLELGVAWDTGLRTHVFLLLL